MSGRGEMIWWGKRRGERRPCAIVGGGIASPVASSTERVSGNGFPRTCEFRLLLISRFRRC